MNPETIAPGVWRLPLPSQTLPPFTTTNTYLIADGGVGVLVDPGFHEAASMEGLLEALERARVDFLKAILLTHTHQDHRAGIPFVQAHFEGVSVFVHPHEFTRLEAESAARDVRALHDDKTIPAGDLTVRSVFTPGHSPGHLSFYLEDVRVALVGDVLASRGSTWVGLPEGDVEDYLASLQRLQGLEPTLLGPGHGETIREPSTRLAEARQHRLERLEQVYKALQEEPLRLNELREAVYPEVEADLERFTEYSLLALLKKLMNDMRVLHLGEDETGPYAVRR